MNSNMFSAIEQIISTPTDGRFLIDINPVNSTLDIYESSPSRGLNLIKSDVLSYEDFLINKHSFVALFNKYGCAYNII